MFFKKFYRKDEQPFKRIYQIGDTIILDNIECVIIAVDVYIEGSDYQNIAIDKNYDLSHYFPEIETFHYSDPWGEGIEETGPFKWGLYGENLFNSREEREDCLRLGQGFKNTYKYLKEASNIREKLLPGDRGLFLYSYLSKFRHKFGKNWFLPSVGELMAVPYHELSFEGSTGAYSSSDGFWSSSEEWSYNSYVALLGGKDKYPKNKYFLSYARLCRVF